MKWRKGIALQRVLALRFNYPKAHAMKETQNKMFEAARQSLSECNGLPIHWFNSYSSNKNSLSPSKVIFEGVGYF
ncbi:hypothetical protein [Paenibacillus sp. MBLB4367]|uniref:hypothetical protein n=1 Tax=Paenibacillus sp. MBLB4367 TaxID=3384767 RepID=UPI0039082A73